MRIKGGVGESRIAGRGHYTNGRVAKPARGAFSVGRGRGRGRGRVAGGKAFLRRGKEPGFQPQAREGKGIVAARKRLVRLSDGQLHHVVVLGAPGASRKLQTVSLPPPAIAANLVQEATRGRRGGRVSRTSRRVSAGLNRRRTAGGTRAYGAPLTAKTWSRPPSLIKLPSMIWRRPGSSVLSPTGGLSAALLSPSASAAASVRARVLLAARGGTPRGGSGRGSGGATAWSRDGQASTKASIKGSGADGASLRPAVGMRGSALSGSPALGTGLRTFCPRYCLTGVCEEASAVFMGRRLCPFQHDPKKVTGRGVSSRSC